MKGLRLASVGKWPLLTLGGTLTLVLMLLALATGLFYTESGSAWLLRGLSDCVPGLVVTAPQGSLLGGDFSARLLRYEHAGTRVQIDGLRWHGLVFGRSHIELATLQIDRLEYASPPTPSSTPLRAPSSLRLPLDVAIKQIDIGSVQAGGATLNNISGALHLGSMHQLTLRHLRWDQLLLDGELRVAATAPLTLQGQLHLQLAGRGALPWNAQADLQGTLNNLGLRLALQAAHQSLHLSAQLQPFERWPVQTLDAAMTDLDLAALSARLPQTRLSGWARLNSSSWQQAARLEAQLDNALAGPWDRARLPVQTLRLVLAARPDQPEHLLLQSLDARLGSAAQAGGRVQASGQHDAAGWTLNARLDGLHAEALDSRLAALRGSGTVRLSQRGSAPAAATLDLGLTLADQPISLQARATLDGQDLTLSSARLSAGAAHISTYISAQGRATLGAQAHVEGQVRMQDFDPRLFWTGLSAASHLDALLDARLQFGGALPQGTAHLQLQPGSSLLGVPLSGRIAYLGAGAAQLTGQLDDAGNALSWQATLPARSGPATLVATLQAPQLAALQPLLAWWQPGTTLAGAVQGTLHVSTDSQGHHWTSDGSLSTHDLSVGAHHLAHGELSWQAAQALDAPLKLQARLDEGQTDLSLNLAGSWAQHQLSIQAHGPMQPPAALRSLLGADSLTAEINTSLQGALSAAPDLRGRTPLQWQARQWQVQLRPQGQAEGLISHDLALGVQFDAGLANGPSAVTLAPGRLQIGSAAVTWQRVAWQAPRVQGQAASLDAQLQLQALAVAPFLQRWQPDLGWGGDLRIGGHLSLHSSPAIELDAALERLGGDLSVSDAGGQSALGLNDLRLAVRAQNGVWQFSQTLSGPGLGTLSSALVARSAGPASWPDAHSALEGQLQARVADVAHWGRWVPPGWRLAGALDAGVKIGGRLGAPLLTGQAQGAGLALSNPLLGVDLHDLGFLLKLNGSEARLERFSAHAAEGSLSMSGSASLGDQPRATLKLQSKGFAVLNRVDRRLLVSGNAEMQLAEHALDLSGRFKIDSGLIDISHGDAPSLDGDVRVLRPTTAAAAAASASAPAGPPRRSHIALQLDLGNQLQLRGHGLESHLEGLLKLQQSDGTLSVTGQIKTVGGTYAAYGQQLDISRGVLSFVGPYDNPRLDVLALRPNLDVEVGVLVTGTALSPHVALYSDPDMADIDKLSWLVTGSASDSLGRSDTALLQAAALALLSGEGESPSGRLLKTIGLDKLSVAQSDDSTQGTIVSVGKQLSQHWYVGYERGLNATSGSWQLIYRMAQRFTVRAQGGDQNSLDLIWQWKWN